MGKYDWMFDVLTDIEDYARINDLPHIADEVERARQTAKKELSDRRNVAAAESARPASLFRARIAH